MSRVRDITPISALLLAALPAAAQVTLDGSVGPAGSVPLVSSEYSITGSLGTYSGTNLFHSFSSFDVASGHTATFSASQPTGRVIARVTGGTRSHIGGTLRSTIEGADLFLLNPSGVSLEDGARLDVDGSFYTSTAGVLSFQTGPDFATSDATPGPLLSSAAPAAFGFTSGSPSIIEVARTNQLAVPAGETLSIVGGDVFVTGDFAELVIRSPGAHLEVAAAAGPIDIPVALADLDMETVEPGTLGVISAFNATIDMSGAGETPAGSVLIRGGRFILSGGSVLMAQNPSDADAVGPIDIAVTDDLRLLGTPVGFSQTLIQSWALAAGAAGDIELHAGRFEMSGGAQIQPWSGGFPEHAGRAPDVEISARVVEIMGGSAVEALALSAGAGSRIGITAAERIAIGDGAAVVADLLPGHSGTPGVIALEAPQVAVSGDAQISTLNAGDAGGVRVEVRAGRLVVEDGGGIVTVSSGAASTGGALDLAVGELAVTDAGRISSIREGGVGGDIGIEADHVRVDNSAGRPEGTFISADDGGAITVLADLVELFDGGQIITRSFADAPAGTLSLDADTILASGVDAHARPSGLFSRARESASPTGVGGLLSIDTRLLEVDDGAAVSSETLGAADAGRVEIAASERVTVRGGANGFSLVAAAAVPLSAGDGGVIRIDTPFIELRDGGQVTTSTGGTGDAGRIDVRADRIEVSGVDPLSGVNRSGFFSRSNTAAVSDGGDGGDIGITATQGVWLSDGGLVSASSSGAGLAGDVFIDAGQLLQMENANVSTEALASTGGNVKVTADSLVYLNDSSIQTDVFGGAGGGGDVTIDPVHTVLNHSSITARAVEGDGGNLLIQTDHYFQSGDSFLDASSQLGIDGTIQVTAPDTDLTGGLARLPSSFLDASAQLERDCAARTERAGSFAVRVQTLPPAPDSALGPVDAGYCPASEATP
jgi:filamentous hemagglutinin family protein